MWAALFAGVWLLPLPLAGNTAVLRGKIEMEDGSPPNRAIGIERYCQNGARQVAVADRKGVFVFSMEIDPLTELACVLRAVLDGYESTVVEISSFNWFTDPNLPTIVLRRRGSGSVNNDEAIFDQSGVPLEAKVAWEGAVRAVRLGNWVQAERQLRSAVQAAPRFAQGWYGLGYARAQMHKPQEAQEALRQAVERNPKSMDSYVLLARVSNEARDWQSTVHAAETVIREETKKRFPEIYSDLAIARFQLKDLEGAQAAVEEGIRLDQKRAFPRNEYILGAILSARQNYDAARTHFLAYLELAPKAADASELRSRLDSLGKTNAAEFTLEAPVQDPVSADGEAWVPGGIKALATIAQLQPVPSYASFFSQYCRAIANEMTIGQGRGIPDYAPALRAYFASIAELSALGERTEGRTEVTVSVATDDQRKQAEKIVSLLGWRLVKQKEGGYTVEPGTQPIDAQRQPIPAALGVDEISLREALEAGREYRFEILTENARFVGGAAWQQLFRDIPTLPPGGIAASLTLDTRMAKSCAGLAAMSPETAASLMTSIGLRNLVTRYADVLSRYGAAFEVSAAGVALPGGAEAEPAWRKLAGVRPNETAAFLRAVVEKQEGRLAAFYSALNQADEPHRRFFTKTPERAERFFNWYRQGEEFRLGLARQVDGWRTEFFRALPLDSEGNVRFPGGKSAWGSAGQSDEEVLLSSRNVEALVPLAQLEEKRKAPFDEASVRLIALHYEEWRALFPYFARSPRLGAEDFRALAAFHAAVSAQAPAAQNAVLGEWLSLVELIDRGLQSGALSPAAAAAAFRRASVDLLASDHSAKAITLLRELAGGGADLDRSVPDNLLRLSGERRSAFDAILKLQSVAKIESLPARAPAQAAAILSGYVYAAALQPDVLLLTEDRHLLSKHRFVVESANPKSGLVFHAAALVHPPDASGAFLAGGFAGFDEVARRLARAAPPRAVAPAGSAPVELPHPASASESAPIEADFRVSARLVEVYATVKDSRGRYLDDLTADQFTVLDEHQSQQVVAFEAQGSEVSCALLLDTTGSMQLALPSLKGAALKLIADLRPADSAAVYSFNDSVAELQPLTTDKAAVSRAIVRTHAQGETALYDALTEITHDLAGRPGKKVIVLFTDGKDNSSTLTADSAINRAKLAGIPVYTISEGEAVSEPALIAQLAGISKATGGEAFVIRNPGEIAKVFEKVSEDLAHGYLLSFPPPSVDTNAWRAIEVNVQLKGAKVHSREGYFPLPDTN